MNDAFNVYWKYAIANRLMPEPEKTQALIISGGWKDGMADEMAVHMAGKDVKPQDAIKVLGVIFDAKLNWEAHNAVAAAKARGAAWRVWRATKALPVEERGKLMDALIHPILDYS